MGSLIGYIVGLTALLTFIGVGLQSIDSFVEASDKNNLRIAVENFWLSTAQLSTAESVAVALKSRSHRMKRSVPKFLRLFWLMLLLMFVIICTENFYRSDDDLKKDATASTTVDFIVLSNTYYIEAENDLSIFCAGHRKECNQFGDELAWRHEISKVAQLESSYKDLIANLAENHAFSLRIAADATAALVILLLAVPLSLSLFLSFNFTLWLLSKITSSSWKFGAILLIDVAVAVISPVILLNTVIYIGIQLGVNVAGGLVDFSSFNEANIFALILGSAAYIINANFIGFSGTSWFMYMVSDWTVRVVIFAMQIIFLFVNIYYTVINFLSDSWRAVNFDFNTGYVNGAVNWAIVVDVFYSAVFFVPGLIIVLIQRWPFGQRVLLNCIQWVAEHPKSPVYAIGSGLAWLAGVIAKLLTGKPP